MRSVGVCGEVQRRGGEEEAGGGSGLKSRGLFDLVVTVTALKTDLGRTKSEDISLTLATSVTTPSHHVRNDVMFSRNADLDSTTSQEVFL